MKPLDLRREMKSATPERLGRALLRPRPGVRKDGTRLPAAAKDGKKAPPASTRPLDNEAGSA